MDEIILTSKEREDLIKLHNSIKEKRLADRVKCIVLLSDGYTQNEVASILFITARTVFRYKELFNESIEKLLEWEYKGRFPKLSPQQEMELIGHLRENLYSTSSEIANYIKMTFNVDFTSDGLVITLHRLGFSYKKTKLVPSKADRAKQEKFVEEYKELRKNLKEDEKIYFMDAVHPTHNSKPGRGWIETGTEKEIKSNTGRERVNINGVYNPCTHEIIVREDKSINSDSTIELFKTIESKHLDLSTIYIISDNAKYYYSKNVRTYLETSRIVLVPLPSYSPNLNLIERLWKLFKKNVVYNKYYEKFLQFKNAVFDFFENKIHLMGKELESLMTEKFHLVT